MRVDFRGLAGKIAGGVSGGVATVATFLGVSKPVAAAISVMMLGVGAGTAGSVAGDIFGPLSTEVAETTIWVDDEEPCRDVIEETDDDEGEVIVPESLTFHNRTDGACPGPSEITASLGHHGSWEGHARALANDAYLATGTDQRKLAELVMASGDTSGSFDKLNGKYIVAVEAYAFAAPGNEMANIGDELSLFFDDGTEITAIVGDWKGWDVENHKDIIPDPTQKDSWLYMVKEVDPQGRTGYGNGWGHGPFGSNESNTTGPWDVNILEFWGIDAAGDPMAGSLQADTGGSMTRLASFTNNGMSSEFASMSSADSSILASASSAKTVTRNRSASNAVEECKAKPSYDNSTLAAALVSYSFSQRHVQPDSEPGTKLYQQVCEQVLGTGDITASYHYHSCDRGVAAAVRWTGADPNFPAGDCGAQLEYCRSTTSLWQPVEGAQNVSIGGNDDWAQAHGLQPGDVGFTTGNGGHTVAYVGHDAIAQGYENSVKGTDGDIGEPTATSAWVMASAHQRAAGMQDFADGRTYFFFRYIGDYSAKDESNDILAGAMGALGNAKKGGSDCDCIEEEPELTCGEKMAQRALELCASAVESNYLTEEDLWGDGVYIDDPDGFGKIPGSPETLSITGGCVHIIPGHASSYFGDTSVTDIPHARIYGLPQTEKFIKWMDEVCIPGGYQNSGWFCCCSPWVAGVLRELEYDTDFPIVAMNQTEYALDHPEKYTVIQADPNKSIDEQCKPGDILNNPTIHTAMYVGNDLASAMYPGTSGNVCEAGQFSHRWLGCTHWDNLGSDYNIIRVKCPDSASETGITGIINDGTLSIRQNAVITAAKSTPSPGANLCATWIHMVFANAGMESYMGNACDIYAKDCHSSNKSELKPGMVVAVSSHSHTEKGKIYGHVGIYIGNNKIMDSIGEIRTMDVDEWINYYGDLVTPRWGWYNGVGLK